MDWITNICGCLPFRESIIGYLNSSEQASQVIEEEKGSQEAGPSNVYEQAKMKSFNFMKLEENSDDEDEAPNYYKQEKQEEENDEIIGVLWYPRMKGEKWDHYRNLLHVKKNILTNILAEKPSSSNFDRIYDSQDDLELVIYSKMQTLPKGKKINTYRFSFKMGGTSLPDYQQWLNNSQQKGTGVESLLQSAKHIQNDPNDESFQISHRFYKKLLIINPHEFTVATKTDKIEDEDLGTFYSTVFFSVKESEQGKTDDYSKGMIHLLGIKVTKEKDFLLVEGYLNMELQVSVSPNMLKQPIAKQIRVFVQKFVCSLKKLDEI